MRLRSSASSPAKTPRWTFPRRRRLWSKPAPTFRAILWQRSLSWKAWSRFTRTSNVRVRSLRARVDELRRQLGEMAGAKPSESGAEGASSSTDAVIGGQASGNQVSDMIYPSIRQLPLVAVRWAELYQQAKIQETVFQLLTQEYELAKVQEAKDIPTAKVMDEAALPERKAFPPRMVFVILGALLGLITGSAIVLGFSFWQAIEPEDPAKELTLEVVRAQRAWFMRRREQCRRFFSRSPAPPPLQHSERSGADD